ncbi:MAG: HNH endonuclease signature motif containing protein [Anaeromyxobacter sp.]
METRFREIVVWAREPVELVDVKPPPAYWGRLEAEPAPGDETAPLRVVFARGGRNADFAELGLVHLARAQGRFDALIAEGLHQMQRGNRLAELGYHLRDYGREMLDLGERATRGLAALGRALRERKVLRAALWSGDLKLRAAQVIVPVAKGEAEAEWVEKARQYTVRALELEVRAVAGAPPDDEDAPLYRILAQTTEDERLLIDEALELAGRVEPGASRTRRIEVIVQEFLGAMPGSSDQLVAPTPSLGFRPLFSEPQRRAMAEAEQGGWAHLPKVEAALLALEIEFDDADDANTTDAKLRQVARARAELDEIVAELALGVKQAGVHRKLGFDSFAHYVEERLGLPARALEQRVAVEGKVQASLALQAAREAGLPYQRLCELARLPEAQRESWREHATEVTSAQLRVEVAEEQAAQLRAASKVSAVLPEHLALLLAAAVFNARAKFGTNLSMGRCLAIMSAHFLVTWEQQGKQRKTKSQEIRARDDGRCQVPGCSHASAHAHHIIPRSRGGTDDPENLVGLCSFHHLVGVHGGYLEVYREPVTKALVWLRQGQLFTGRPEADPLPVARA